MKPAWDDVNARARGLATHLLSDAAMRSLESRPDLASLASGLREHGIAVPEGSVSAAALEQAVRRVAGDRLALVLRWCGHRADALALLVLEEDRRSIRALLHGAAEGAPADVRMTGLLPTPQLPESALQELARQPGVSACAALLIAWRHPLAPALRPEAFSSHPDLAVVERSINRLFAVHALREARRAGRQGALAEQVRLVIDLENALTALSLAGDDGTVAPKDVFLPGGSRVHLGEFDAACRSADTAAAARRLAALFKGMPVAGVFERADGGDALEEELLRARIRLLERPRRERPLGPETVMLYLLQLRLELIQLRRIIWSGALHLSAAGAA